MDLVAGIPTGSIRVSFGYMSTMEDVHKLISFIKDCFLEVKELVAPIAEPKSIQSPPDVPAMISSASEIDGNVISTGVQVTVISDGSCSSNTILENIFLYPVKSCACFKVSHYKGYHYDGTWLVIVKVSKWPVGDKGLLYDREWMIVKPSGNCLTQKEEPNLCLISPHLDLDQATLTLTAAGKC